MNKIFYIILISFYFTAIEAIKAIKEENIDVVLRHPNTQVKWYGPYTALYDRLRLPYRPYYRRNIGHRNMDHKVTVYEP